MGGNAFADLNVPRLPHDIYHMIRTQCHAALESFYEDVVSPPEAPDKADHGDVDFLVARPKQQTDMPVADIAAAIGAVHRKHTSNSKTTHFALPVPGRADAFAQVDVHVCPAPYFAWELFLQSYGDALQILGVLNRPLGLTANDKGLHVRIAAIEAVNRKKAMVFLTASPRAMLTFLRLDVEQYEAGFSSNAEVFRWCLSGGLYAAPKVKEESANDRNRLRKRDMFTTCLREWFPAHEAELFPPTRRAWTREEVLEEALAAFPEARLAYQAALAEHAQDEWELGVLAEMRKVGPAEADEKDMTEVVRGSKRFVDFVDGGWVVTDAVLRADVEQRPMWLANIKLGDEEAKAQFLNWLRENWSSIHVRERERMRSKEMENTGATLETLRLSA